FWSAAPQEICHDDAISSIARRGPVEQRIGGVTGVIIAHDLLAAGIFDPQRGIERQTERGRAQTKFDLLAFLCIEDKTIFIARRIDSAADRDRPMQRLHIRRNVVWLALDLLRQVAHREAKFSKAAWNCNE